MNRMLTAWLTLCALAGLTLLAACGGDDGESEPEVDLTAVAGTPGGLPTPTFVDGIID